MMCALSQSTCLWLVYFAADPDAYLKLSDFKISY